ncbi:unnamed protein product, partial [Vitis vinifera]|uniref:Uncharacterized protein n=1 Tax=Vitis vinifera TaxID=29760 RepID=E0CUN1_VITVI
MEEARAVGERSAVLFNLLQQCRGKFINLLIIVLFLGTQEKGYMSLAKIRRKQLELYLSSLKTTKGPLT